MKTITIDILNDRALNLLRELEALNLIKMLTKSEGRPKDDLSKKKASQYKGIISADEVEKLQQQVKESRQEWKSRT